MTAIIIGLIAALGIGGGIAVANNSGGGGHSSPAISGPENPGEDNPAANLDPNYELISFLTDQDQYEITTGTESTLMLEDQASQAKSIIKKASRARNTGNYYNDNHTIYGNPEDDLAENGHIVGEELEEGGYWALNLKAGTGALKLGKVDANKANFNSPIPLNASNRKNQSEYYDTYLYNFDETRYSKVHLGGTKLKLTVADFGRWEMGDQNDNSMITFFMYDEKYAYKGNRRDNVRMEGYVMVNELRNTDNQPKQILTGNIYIDLNLAKNTLSGNVQMHEGVPEKYNVDFTGNINETNNSIVHIDGAYDTAALPRQEGEMRGGVGKLLQGKHGLEMVGNFGPQLELPSIDKINQELNLNLKDIEELYDLYEQHDSSINYEKLRDLYESGKVDYTFGAKEVK